MKIMLQLESTSNTIANLTTTVANLTEGLRLQIEATKPQVEAWNSAKFFQKFVIWLSGFSGIGFLIAWYNDLFTK